MLTSPGLNRPFADQAAICTKLAAPRYFVFDASQTSEPLPFGCVRPGNRQR